MLAPLQVLGLTRSPLVRASADRKAVGPAAAPRQYVLGVNKYSHDASACLISTDGAEHFVSLKERVTRAKHDGGDVTAAVEAVLETAGASLDDVVAVCGNHHHHRIAPFEARLRWAQAAQPGVYPPSALSPFNLLPRQHELSHHLAHAWSVLAQCPFDDGLIVVMDGMGETLAAMATAGADDAYTHDLQLPAHASGFAQVPAAPAAHVQYREAESAYAFEGRQLTRVFKRWAAHRSPPELYNFGFENLESLGAVYSRVSSHTFGDWNLCGKVMGLAPWADALGAPPAPPLIRGAPDDGLRVDWAALDALPCTNSWATLPALQSTTDATDGHRFFASLAAAAQGGLEEATLPFLRRLRRRTGARNLCLVGGVALNSVLNGRIAREAGFERVWVPPYPGDDGIAVGCAAFALHELIERPPPVRGAPLSAYLGRAPAAQEVAEAIADNEPWLLHTPPAAPGGAAAAVDRAASALLRGEIVAWFDGRSEIGARALGHRSILADPRRAEAHFEVNVVKRREQFRPLAPSVLAEHADEWFSGLPEAAEGGSVYMQLTASVRPERRAEVPAITHVDGSARLQTVAAADAPTFHALILAFFAACGVPLVLNTSFNLAGEPIVDSPADAIRSFLCADAALTTLFLDGHELRRRPFPSAWRTLTPAHEAAVVSRVVANAYGEELSVEVQADGVWLELSGGIALAVLERCDGVLNGAQIAEQLAEEGGIDIADVEARLRELFSLRLVRL